MSQELLQEAKELLEKAEKTVDFAEKNKYCDRAIEIFEEVEDSASESDANIIRNLRKSFARAQLNSMSEMSMKDLEPTKFFFSHLFRFPKQIHELIGENPGFKDKFRLLASRFNKDLDNL